MLISYTSAGTVQLKTRTEPVVLSHEVTIGSRALTGPGEYDVANIQCEAHAIAEGLVYLIRDEDLLITYLTKLDQNVTKLDSISDTAILILDIRSDDTAAPAKAIIKAIEPAYVFLMGSVSPELVAELGLSAGEGTSLKVTRTSLPLEGTTLYRNA